MELLRCVAGWLLVAGLFAGYWFGTAWSVKDDHTSWWKAQTLPLFLISATAVILGLVYAAWWLLKGCCVI